EQQKLAADANTAGLPNELTSSEIDVAMKEFMDVSRQALRMGAREVHLVCLQSRQEMPASEEEIEEGLVEGIRVHPSLGPKQFVGQNGKVTGLEVIRCSQACRRPRNDAARNPEDRSGDAYDYGAGNFR